MKSSGKRLWKRPTVTEFDIAERTLEGPGDGPDGAFGDPEGGNNGGGNNGGGNNGGGNNGGPGS